MVVQTASLADSKPVDVKFDLPHQPITIDADVAKIKQAVTNLVANAIKYTDRGTVTVSVSADTDQRAGHAGGWARISIHDTGVGIKPEDCERLFTKFTQLDGSARRRVGGTGLGLVLASEFVHLHGGRIDVTSEFGKGSEFTILLPLVSRVAVSTQLNVDLGPPSALSSDVVIILCIDDEPDTLKYLQLTFEDAGYGVLVAGDHDSAIAQAKLTKPDLICLDICMPGKDGYEVLNSLRADPELASVPVIVASAKAEEAQAFQSGACCYLTKPVDSDRLVDEVRNVLAGEIESALIVEDNPDTSKLLAESLSEYGVEVRTAFNGKEGLSRLGEFTPSVIILDLMMPIMDGFTFLEHVRVDPVWKGIPVVILTAKTLERHEMERLSKVTSAIVTKGRDNTVHMIDAALKSILPKRRKHAGAKS